MANKQYVFVYGTLRKNERNHRLLTDAKCIAEQAWTTGLLFNTAYGYPVLQSNSQGLIYGELYEVNHTQLEKLDELEGYLGEGKNNYYDRSVQRIFTDQGIHEAYVYVMNKTSKNLLKEQIEGGDWKVFRYLQQGSYRYFAYGSCMDNVRFKKANVNHYFQKVIGRGVLEGYSLGFTRRAYDGGRADILEKTGVVEGKVYEITPHVLPYLYRREGVKSGCYRPAIVELKMEDNTLREALTFVVINKEEEVAPPAHYLEEIIRGGTSFLSDTYMENLINRFKNILS